MASRNLLILVFVLLSSACASDPQHGTMVHLFEWRWSDIAQECENFLGQAGYAAVQVSPPQEHVTGPQWWTRYQPVSYKLESRGGTRSEFIDMVRRCKAAGVDIYVDAVINHMSGVGRGVGVAGSQFSKHCYPAVPYSPLDFHFCGRRPGNVIANYQDPFEVRNCELLSLADLALEKDYVRGKVAGYLNDLLGVGVAGFRYDAAKHMEPRDLAAIRGRLSGNPYIFQEVIDQNGSEPIRAAEYFGTGDVTEFRYGLCVAENVMPKGKMKYLRTFGENCGLMPSDKAVVFLSNHDNERPGHGGGGSVLTFRNGQVYELANVLMLAWPYGYPKVMSSFEFGGDGNRGPPGSSPYQSGGIRCGINDAWKCQHRWTPIAGMVRFRKVAGDAPVSKWWSRGDAIAFGRGDKAFVVINREEFSISESFATGLPPGQYCNVLAHAWKDGACSGPLVSVGGDHRMSVSVAPLSAAAFHIAAKKRGVEQNLKSKFKSMFGAESQVQVQEHVPARYVQWFDKSYANSTCARL